VKEQNMSSSPILPAPWRPRKYTVALALGPVRLLMGLGAGRFVLAFSVGGAL
jgi:hypothetical protein